MSTITQQKNGFTVKAYPGDAKTLLAFDLGKAAAKNLAGFTIQCQPPGSPPFFLLNSLQFEDPSKQSQDKTQPATSSINAPIQKFRWIHIPGSAHEGTDPSYGTYTYTVTPRYFDKSASMLPLDNNLSVSVAIRLAPFVKGSVEVGFTRGYVQSEAFVHHFGPKAVISPAGKALQFDTSQNAGKNAAGQTFSYADEYAWLGFTAREKVFGILNEVLGDSSLKVDVFAYDLNEPDVVGILLKLARLGRIRVILDNASLHHNKAGTTPEDQFQKLFEKTAKTPASILRGKFGRYAHDKVFVVSNDVGPIKVLTGSTNFSVTGLYVNSNHVVIFNDPKVASAYSTVFNDSWNCKATMQFAKTAEAGKVETFSSNGTPKTDITFSPHEAKFALSNLTAMAARIAAEDKAAKGSVLFAVMAVTQGQGPVLPALQKVHSNQKIFSYGISDAPGGTYVYTRRSKNGVLAGGKPGRTTLPAPFNQVPGVSGHQIHDKYVVCGFNSPDPVVYCGSSNLALGGEEDNGDNLIAIHDGDVAAAFAIDAVALVDHFNFLDKCASSRKASSGKKAPIAKTPSASRAQHAVDSHWYLAASDAWTQGYFDPDDLHSVDRELFS